MENSQDRPIELEVEAKTVEEAVQKAQQLLQANKNQLKIKIVSEEHKGLFGMGGARPAKIIATLIKKG